MANSFLEFFARSGGNNMYGGAIAANTEPATTTVYSAANGGWNSGTFIYTPTDNSTPASTVTIGDVAQVFLDSAPTVPVWLGRVTAIGAGVNGTITFGSSTGRIGTPPVTLASGRSINVGGAWAGPSAASWSPASLLNSTSMLSIAGNQPRVNLKNDQTYNMTGTVSVAMSGVTIQGYTSSANDGGKATIDGGTSGTAYVLLGITGTSITLRDLIFAHNGATSSQSMVNFSGTQGFIERCVFHDSRGIGLSVTNGQKVVSECEAYANNASNTADGPGFGVNGASMIFHRCIAHDNTGSSTSGFGGGGTNVYLVNCISDTNGKAGFEIQTGSGLCLLMNCDAYNNTTDGFFLDWAGGGVAFKMENCNAVKNSGYGVNVSNFGSTFVMNNCGFGSGSMVNTLGATNYGAKASVLATGTITYASGVTPWVDPANGDFRINLAASKAAGRGVFTQTASGYTGSVAYPDVGAVQSLTGTGGTFSVATSHSFTG